MGKIIRNGIEFSGTTDTANNINYDNSVSGLEARTAQEAIDELNDGLGDLSDSLDDIGEVFTNSSSQLDLPSGSWYTGTAITLPKGVYVITVRGLFQQNTTGYRALSIGVDSNQTWQGRVISPPANGIATSLTHTAIVSITSDVLVKAFLQQSSGVSLKIDSNITAVRIK